MPGCLDGAAPLPPSPPATLPPATLPPATLPPATLPPAPLPPIDPLPPAPLPPTNPLIPEVPYIPRQGNLLPFLFSLLEFFIKFKNFLKSKTDFHYRSRIHEHVQFC